MLKMQCHIKCTDYQRAFHSIGKQGAQSYRQRSRITEFDTECQHKLKRTKFDSKRFYYATFQLYSQYYVEACKEW